MTTRDSINRRDFLRGVTASTIGLALAVEELHAEAQAADAKPAGPPVSCAVIGLGPQGRDILASLAKLGNAPVVSLCDTYTAAGFVKRANDIAPQATVEADYRKILANDAIKAVFVATPSHLHKQIVLDALQAGKHVYCEAPLASTIEDAREIARAGAAAKTVFQPGLQFRANKMHNHVYKFVKSGALGKLVAGRGQWHNKTSWRFAAPTPEREKELNWRLYKDTSSGLMGEVGIHQLDTATRFLQAQPVSVVAFGGIMQWADDRQVPDTVQAIVEYPNNVRFAYDATLADSFDGAYETLLGSDSAMLIRNQRAWMFKESDAPLLGWEVYAKKDKIGVGDDSTGTGIALVADATKLMALGQEPGKVGQDVSKTALYQSASAFLDAIRTSGKPAADAAAGFEATVVALKAHEAVMSGSKITFDKAWFTL